MCAGVWAQCRRERIGEVAIGNSLSESWRGKVNTFQYRY